MKTMYPFLLGATFVIVIAIVGSVYFKNQVVSVNAATTQQTQSTVTPMMTQTPSPKQEKKMGTGTIEGSLSYPSEGIPENMVVCAESKNLETPICTSEKITNQKYTYGKGYVLQVPAGSYFVYAKLPDNDYSAYYSEFVTCGLLASCTDHTPIEVTVVSNQTVKADPQDWYNTQPSI